MQGAYSLTFATSTCHSKIRTWKTRIVNFRLITVNFFSDSFFSTVFSFRLGSIDEQTTIKHDSTNGHIEQYKIGNVTFSKVYRELVKNKSQFLYRTGKNLFEWRYSQVKEKYWGKTDAL